MQREQEAAFSAAMVVSTLDARSWHLYRL